MKFIKQPLGRLLDSSYFRQMASVAYLLLLVILLTMIAIGCLFRAVAFGHVQETLLNEISQLDLANKSAPQVHDYLDELLRERPKLAEHAIYLNQDHQPELGNAALMDKLLCDHDGCELKNPTDSQHHLATGTVGVRMNLGEAGELILAYDMDSMMLRVQPVPLIAGMIMLTVLVIVLFMTLRAGQHNLGRIDNVLRSMQRFSSGRYDLATVNVTSNDEIDQLNVAVVDNLKTIKRLLNEVSGLSHHIAHEMRTPLTRLQNHLSDIIEQAPNSIVPELHQLQQECGSIQTLFSALLQIGEVETGRRRSAPTLIDLPPLLDDLVDYYQPLAEDQGNQLQLLLSEDVRFLRGDRSLIMQVVSNLIENAMKYAAGQGDICVHACRRNGQLVLAVSDQGPGIAEHQYDKAIERFARLDDRPASAPGYGLGLTLVRAVADYHQAQLVFSNNQPGLRVELRFPERLS